ncbi:defensin j1-2 [Phtheirospermum japonicum]|uniref:Defensin j1-2 n=1 Tax=Phtheirospermum japonicum TaxID=374723 RepID=A0A830CGP1_9LAMI|nr:defensin j1-2 [Phtheirospermum japonicum]
MQGEAAICETGSKQFKGICFNNENCATICEKEGFISGRCKGFFPTCTCAKQCPKNTAPNAGTGPPEADNPPETVTSVLTIE